MPQITREQAEQLKRELQSKLGQAKEPSFLAAPPIEDMGVAPTQGQTVQQQYSLRQEEPDFFDTAGYFFGKGEEFREQAREQIPVTGPISLLQRGVAEAMPYYGGLVGGASDIASSLLYDVTPIGEAIQPAMSRETAERKLARDLYAMGEVAIPEFARPVGLISGKVISDLSSIRRAEDVAPEIKPTPEVDISPEPLITEAPVIQENILDAATVPVVEPVAPSVTQPSRLDELGTIDPADDIVPFNPQAAAEIRETLGETAEFAVPRLAEDVTTNIHKASEEILKLGEVSRNPNVRISDQIFELLQTNRLSGEAFEKVLSKNNISKTDFAQIYRADIREAARTLGQLGAASKRLNRFLDEAGSEGKLLDEIIEMNVDDFGAGVSKKLRELDNIRRGALVSQIGTTVRNVQAQFGRVGMDTLTKAMDNTLQQMFSTFVDPLTGQKGRPVDWSGTFDLFMNISKNKKNAKKISDWILSTSPQQQDKLFTNYLSDVSRISGKGLIGKASKAVNALNFLNRAQEYYFRNGMFATRLAEIMREKGLDLNKMFEAGDMSKISKADIEDAVDTALEFTYSKTPPPDSVMGSAVNFINKLPFVLTSVIPFPRFMANALKFQFEHSPLGAATLLTPAQLKALAKGDKAATKKMSKAMVGSAALYAAYQFRDSEYAGEKWYEAKGPNGKRIDLRPYFPLTPYLLIADIIKRMNEGTVPFNAKDIIQGLSGAQFRGGTGLALVDNIINDVSGVDSTDKVSKSMARYVTDILSGYLTPFRMLKDFAEPDQTYRTPEVTGEIGTDIARGLARNIPYLEKALDFPESEIPTRAGGIKRFAPASRQLLGASITLPKNPAEAEFDRLGLKRKDILPYTGDTNADQLISKYMGPLVEKNISQLVQSPRYKEATNPQKIFIVGEALKPLRAIANKAAKKDNPKLFLKLAYKRLPMKKRRVIEEKLGGVPDFMEK